ncbi:MAG TPA: DNA polymerase III subunit gamma/tau [Bacteriovoracaceae bacterium]|nr:DNA polymerase III subunit gamma/tau [Bacteriovoracaceae bacterium]
MAYQVLARKWRPKQFEQVVGQVHVTRTLQNAIKHNKLAHAYLFTGTRGVGKTSIARLFTKAIRCENPKADFNPCLECQSCHDIDSSTSMDYLEIDGASNNSVDDIRNLIESVQYLPSRGKYKIYVIDEVHMLSTSAFNALLKTLEEPPAHAIFILATTDPQKLLGTVISRCQRHDFKNVSVPTLEEHIKHIAKVEGIEFENDRIIHKLAQLGRGSVRDTLSIFDQVLGMAAGEIISEKIFAESLGLAAGSVMKSLTEALFTGNTSELKKVYTELVDSNIDLKKLTEQILENIYEVIDCLDNPSLSPVSTKVLSDLSLSEIFWIYETLAKDFTWVLSSLNPEKVILVMLQKVALRRQILSPDGVMLSSSPVKVEEKSEGKPEAGETEKVEPKKVVKTWEGFLTHLKAISPATLSNLEQGNLVGEPDFSSSEIFIELGFPEESGIFKEFLEDKEVYERLIDHLAEYFEISKQKIRFKTSIVNTSDEQMKDFKTRAQLAEEKKLEEANKKREEILNNPSIQAAQKLFNARIDKINLK